MPSDLSSKVYNQYFNECYSLLISSLAPVPHNLIDGKSIKALEYIYIIVEVGRDKHKWEIYSILGVYILSLVGVVRDKHHLSLNKFPIPEYLLSLLIDPEYLLIFLPYYIYLFPD